MWKTHQFGVAIGRREGFGAVIGREAISAQDIGLAGGAIDRVGDTLSGSSRTNYGAGIERGKRFDDAGGDMVNEWGGEAGVEGIVDCCEANFGFVAWRVRICSWSLVLPSNLVLQRLRVYPSARFLASRTSSCCLNDSFAFCFILPLISNSSFRTRYPSCILSLLVQIASRNNRTAGTYLEASSRADVVSLVIQLTWKWSYQYDGAFSVL